ncbi:MAG: methyltransferase [Chloroflexi bacterium]|nr:methyltransferase [Chloroflexota bacterium]
MLTSRERVELALNHQSTDRVPLDLGGCGQTGMHVTTVYRLRQALGLDAPGTPVRVSEPYQMLGEIAPDLLAAIGGDVVSVGTRTTMLGFPNERFKSWTFHDGTPLLVADKFNTTPDANGDILMYPEGDQTVPPSCKMPAGGWYFDSIMRQPEIDDTQLDPADNVVEFGVLSDDELHHLACETEHLYDNTDKAIMLVLPGMGFGDVAIVPGPMLKYPKGIRDVSEWYVSTVTRPDYVRAVFERQCTIALENLPRIYEAVGDRISVAWISGTDFGAQNGLLISLRSFRSLFKPFYTRVNEWIMQNTRWHRFIHTCGSIAPLIPDLIEAGFDILNPIQTSAANMDPADLKRRFGKQITFWGGGVDTQHTLPFGTADEVRREVVERLTIFSEGGGFIFNPSHNVQAQVPVENLLAMYDTVQNYRSLYTRM